MNTNELELSITVKTAVSKNPSLFGDIVMACTQGIDKKVQLERDRATDFETIAVACMAVTNENRKSPTTIAWAEKLIKDKLSKWEGKSQIQHSKLEK